MIKNSHIENSYLLNNYNKCSCDIAEHIAEHNIAEHNFAEQNCGAENINSKVNFKYQHPHWSSTRIILVQRQENNPHKKYVCTYTTDESFTHNKSKTINVYQFLNCTLNEYN